MIQIKLDLSRFDAAPLIAFTATKEIDYGTETDGSNRRRNLAAGMAQQPPMQADGGCQCFEKVPQVDRMLNDSSKISGKRLHLPPFAKRGNKPTWR